MGHDATKSACVSQRAARPSRGARAGIWLALLGVVWLPALAPPASARQRGAHVVVAAQAPSPSSSFVVTNVYGAGMRSPGTLLVPFDTGGDVTSGDLNGDLLDEVVVGFGGSIKVFEPAAPFTSPDFIRGEPLLRPADFGAFPPGSVLAAGDADGDGDDDVAIGVPAGTGGDIRIVDREGARVGGFPAPAGFELGGDIAMGDADGDGDADVALIFPVSGGPGARVEIRDRSGVLLGGFPVTALLSGSPGSGGRIAMGDVDGDGAAEVAFLVPAESFLPSHVEVRHSDGTPLDSITTALVPGARIAMGDVDADGDAEIAVGLPGDEVRFIDPEGSFAGPSGPIAFPAGASLALGRSVFSTATDTDGDSLLDAWEIYGIDRDYDASVDLDLPQLGADPDHKDIFLELDWSNGFEPSQGAIRSLKTAFAYAPRDAGGIPYPGLLNPDGTPGIRLWVDTGTLDVGQVSEDGAGTGSCSDGIDNASVTGGFLDGADQIDPQCAGFEGGIAAGTCNDGVDNGGDGSADLADPDCQVGVFEDGVAAGTCLDGRDNDADGLRDLADPDCLVGDDLSRECANAARCPAGSCRDGADNDSDGLPDGRDADCVYLAGHELFNPTASETGGSPDNSCSDGIDQGAFGVDGADPLCRFIDRGSVGLNSLFYILKFGTEAVPVEDRSVPGSCFDGIDNANERGGPPDGSCSNGVDDDGDNMVDNGIDLDVPPDGDYSGAGEWPPDPDCDRKDGADPDCAPTCFDGSDNDGDGHTDQRDPNCGWGNFSRLRRIAFHYAITVKGAGGTGEVRGNDFFEANHNGATIMHELGHNLGLRHGGGDVVNNKPNYLSVMSYSYQRPGCLFGPGAASASCGRSLHARLLDYSPARWGGSEDGIAGFAVCLDGVDNGGDGLRDADDPDCAMAFTQRAGAPLAPLNESALSEATPIDPSDTGHSIQLWDAQGNQKVVDPSAPIDWQGDGVGPFNQVVVVDADNDNNPREKTPAGPGSCTDGLDNDGDGRCDGAGSVCSDSSTPGDSDCGSPTATERTPSGPGSCGDGVDNDGDGRCDGAGSVCTDGSTPGDPDCAPPPPLVGFDDWSNIRFYFKLFPDAGDNATGEVVEDLIGQGPEAREDELRALGTADLSIEKTTPPGPLEVGADLTYTLRVGNAGPNPAGSVRIADVLPEGTAYLSDTGYCGEEVGGAVVCQMQDLAVGESRAIDVTVDTSGACRDGLPVPLENTASVENVTGPDPDPENDTATATLTPVDTTAPLLTAPPDTGAECSSPEGTPVALGTPDVQDVCDDEPDVSNDAPTLFPLGETLVTWRAVDASGNPSEPATQNVTIVDTIPPEISCNAPATLTPRDAPIVFTATASDVCDGDLVPEVTGFDCFAYGPAGNRVDKTESCVVEFGGDSVTIVDSGGVGDHIVWTVRAQDSSGNPASVECQVEVVNPACGLGVELAPLLALLARLRRRRR
jgi:uncharacterized repeat protein (TIGR01451 family)